MTTNDQRDRFWQHSPLKSPIFSADEFSLQSRRAGWDYRHLDFDLFLLMATGDVKPHQQFDEDGIPRRIPSRDDI
jgi:hypothetical protein